MAVVKTTPQPSTTTPDQRGPGHRSGAWAAALAGAVAAGTALAGAELAAELSTPIPSLLLAVGDGVVDLAAGTPLKSVAIALFGTNDKVAVIWGTVLLTMVFGAGLGLVARRSRVVAGIGFVAFGMLGVAAAAANPMDAWAWAGVAAAVAVTLGVASLWYLSGHIAPVAQGAGRRRFLQAAGGLALSGVVTAAVGRVLAARNQTAASRAELVLPQPEPAPAPAAGSSFGSIEGLTPLYTSNEDFYRIDTALMSPVVAVGDWTLTVHGLVDREVTLDFDDLSRFEQFEADVTIACVSNEVGGRLIGNARWQGVRLAEVLDLAGVDPAAEQVVGRSVDGWTAGFPVEAALDDRDAMIAVGMNGQPLPIDHGFPARLIVPGLYGYVSATKWLADIELTTWDGFDGYWVPRGWSKEGPIKTQSRIDVPARGQRLAAGPTVVAGVAWAQRRGIDRVEVSVDDGPWQHAELAAALNIDTWRQWRFRWDARPGQHRIRVRATDGRGRTQSGEPVPVAPDGAEGYHARIVRVS